MHKPGILQNSKCHNSNFRSGNTQILTTAIRTLANKRGVYKPHNYCQMSLEVVVVVTAMHVRANYAPQGGGTNLTECCENTVF